VAIARQESYRAENKHVSAAVNAIVEICNNPLCGETQQRRTATEGVSAHRRIRNQQLRRNSKEGERFRYTVALCIAESKIFHRERNASKGQLCNFPGRRNKLMVRPVFWIETGMPS
jgi:hypothetical protein